MRDRIIIVDNSISTPECNHLIQFFERSSAKRNWLDYQSLPLQAQVDQQIDNIVSRIVGVTGYEIDFCEIAKRPPGTGHPTHIDDVVDRTVFASITYLNDNFTGGETYFVDDLAVIPKTGRTLYFDGQCYAHGVHTVNDSDRYTLAIWYTNGRMH